MRKMQMIIDTILLYWVIGSVVLFIVSLFASDGKMKRLWSTLTNPQVDSLDYAITDEICERVSIALYYFDNKIGPAKFLDYPVDLSRPLDQAISRLFDATCSPEQSFMIVLLPKNSLLCNAYFSFHDTTIRGEERIFMLSFIVQSIKKQEVANLSGSISLHRVIMGWILELQAIENLSQMITDGDVQTSSEMEHVRSKLQTFRDVFIHFLVNVQN
jgi:hypothetical protein